MYWSKANLEALPIKYTKYEILKHKTAENTKNSTIDNIL